MSAMTNSIVGQHVRRRGWFKERKGHSDNAPRVRTVSVQPQIELGFFLFFPL
jgi:hypothetical protein